jgi:dihydroorotase-like cyclic amidohydrolase
MDLIIRNARLYDRPGEALDIGVERGRIAAIERAIAADAPAYDAKGLLACPGLIESHIHLDKSRIIAAPSGTMISSAHCLASKPISASARSSSRARTPSR